MSSTFIRALALSAPVMMLLYWSVTVFARAKSLWSFLQLFGAGCLVVVVLAHFCEALLVFPWMQWGLPNGAGHYLDLCSAVLGVTLFSGGCLLHAFSRRTA